MYNFQVKRRVVAFSLATFFVLFLSSLLLSCTDQDKTTITLDKNHELSFSSGKLDPNRFEGEIFDVEFLKDGDILATADRLLIETEGEFGNADFILTQLEVDNLASTGDEGVIEAKTLRVNNLSMAGFPSEKNQAAQLEWLKQWQAQWTKDTTPSFHLENVKIAVKKSGNIISFTRFSADPLDANHYQGEIIGLEVLENSGAIVKIDRLLVEGEGEFGAIDFMLKRFEWDNFALQNIKLTDLEPDNSKLSDSELANHMVDMEVATLRVSNLPLANLTTEVTQITPQQIEQWKSMEWKSVEWLEDHTMSYELEDMKMTLEELGIAISIAKISNPAPRFAALADGTAYVVEAKSELSSMRFMPVGKNEVATRFREFLEKIGLEYFEMSLSSKGGMSPVNDDIVFSLYFDDRMTGLLDIFVDSEIYISQDVYKSIGDTFMKFLQDNPNIDYDDGEQLLALLPKYFGPMIKDIRLGKLQITLADKGLLNIMDQFEEVPARAILAPTTEAVILNFLPQTGGNLTPSIRNLLMKGGTLQITAEPKTPFPLTDFGAPLLTPDIIASQLRLSATHQP